MPTMIITGAEAGNEQSINDVNVTRHQTTKDSALMVDTDMIKTTFAAEYAENKTALAIITPPTGYKVCVRDVHITTAATTGEVALDFATSSKAVARLYATAQNRADSSSGHILGGLNEALSITTTTGTAKLFVKVNYVFHK